MVKTYYSDFKNGTAKCNLCLKVIKTSGNTTNMASHMKNKHYDVFVKCNQKKVSINSGENQTIEQPLRKTESLKGDCSPDPDTYTSRPYFESVMLLKNEMKPRKSCGNLETSCSNKRLSIPEFEDSIDPVLSQTLDEQCNSNEKEAFTEKRKRINMNTSSQLLLIEKEKLKLLEKKVNAQKIDDDLSFFDSLLPYMKTMDMKQKLLCRMEIQKVVLAHLGE